LLAICSALLAGSGCTKELRKARHLSRGDAAFQEQRYEQAEIEYLNVLKAAPRNPTAMSRLGIIYQEEGNLPRARFFLGNAAKLDPDNIDVHLKFGVNAVAIGDLKLAADQANWVLAKRPGDIEALQVLSATPTNAAAVQSLIEQVEKLHKADSDRASYHVALGDLALRSGAVTNAEMEFKRALALDPKCSAALGGLGSIYWARKDLAEAEKALKSAAELSPVRSFRRLKYAEFQFSSGKVEDGRHTLEQISKEAPDYLPAWNLLAQLAFSEKRYDDCNAIVQRVLGKDPSYYDALMLNGSIPYIKGDAAKAIANFSKMADIYGRSPQVQFQLARAYLLTNDVAKAMPCLQKAVAADKNFVDAVLLLANINIRKGNPDQAIRLLNELIKSQPQIPQVYLLLADAYVAKKDLDQSLAVCRRMAEAFPKSAEVPMIIGALLVRQNKPDEARKEFEKSLELAPDLLAATEQLVNLDLEQQRYAEATARVQSQIDKNPKAAEPWVLMARIHTVRAQNYVNAENKKNASSSTQLKLADVPAAQPEFSQAEAALQKAIKLNPDLSAPLLMLANLYVAAGKQQNALELLNGLNARTNDVMALMQVGSIQESLKNYSAAREAYEKVISISPNFSAALNNLAYLYAERFNELDKAYQMANKARQLLPDNPSTADTLGWVLYRRGEYNHAVGLLEESASKLPNEPEVQFHLGMTQYMLGNEAAARVALQKAMLGTKSYEGRDGKDEAARRLALLAIDPQTADAAAISELEKALKENPRDPVALERMGGLQEREGTFGKAADTYESALKANPSDAALTIKLAQLYASRLNDTQKALTFAKSAHDLAPDDANVSALLGRLVYQSGDFKWAANLLEESARKMSADPQVAFDLAWAYYSIGRVPESQSQMQMASRAGSGFTKADEANRFLTMVSAAKDPVSASSAAPEAQRILATESNYVPAMMVSALAQEGQGNYQRASEIYNQILSRFPLFAPATRNLGVLYYRKGDYERAARLLKESNKALKEDGILLYYLGKSQYQLKLKSESKASLQQALKFNLPADLAEDARKVLSELK